VNSWLDLAFGEPAPAAIAEGFGVVFRMMLAAVDAADVRLLLSYDEQWSTTLPRQDVGRFDYLGDLIADAHSTLIAGEGSTQDEHKRAVRGALRLLRAVYRFGLAAWILDTAVREGGSPERRLAAQHMAAHFGDVDVLTFVAGRAITVSHDRRLAWWTLLFEPREYDRVVVTSFAPALCIAYMTMLMDLSEQPLLPEAWIEQYQSPLGDAIANAWPLNTEPSFWEGGQAAETVKVDQSIGQRRRTLAITLHGAIEELEQQRALRTQRAALLPERVELFTATARQAWVSHRTLGPALRALGAPTSTERANPVQLVSRALPKPAFVGEASQISVQSYAELVGRDAAREESVLIATLLGSAAQTGDEPAELEAAEAQPLIRRVRDALRGLREAGHTPSLILAPNLYPVWSRLSANTEHMDEDRRRLGEAGVPTHLLRFIRGRIEPAVVISVPGLAEDAVLVLDPGSALKVPGEDRDGAALDVAITERDPAAVEAALLAEQPGLSPETLVARLDERLQEVVVTASVQAGVSIEDASAFAAVAIEPSQRPEHPAAEARVRPAIGGLDDTPGGFSWVELATGEPDSARTYYSELFGWERADRPLTEDVVYTVMELGGKRVAGIRPRPSPQAGAVASVWNSYVTVADADATLDRAGALGATVIAPAFDVMDAGRMGIIADPQGAFVTIWQPRDRAAGGLVDAPGALALNELVTSDLDGAASFYSALFEWSIEQAEDAQPMYLTISNEGEQIGRMRLAVGNEAPRWLVYFGVENLDAVLARVIELHGTILHGPVESGYEMVALVQDPQGAVFGLRALSDAAILASL
jgi:predicted enzyme related to lactoylglutathione lyase